jgi:hypothetical protein
VPASFVVRIVHGGLVVFGPIRAVVHLGLGLVVRITVVTSSE